MRGSFTFINIVFLIYISMTTTVLAEKQEWKDKSYDYKKVRRVAIFDPRVSNKLKNGINENQIKELFQSKIKLPTHIQILDGPAVSRCVQDNAKVDLILLYKQKPQEAENLTVDSFAKCVDLIIQSDVFEYSIGYQYHEGFTYNTTEYQTAFVTGNVNGYNYSGTIEQPITSTNYVPGRNVPVAYSSVRWNVFDPKNKKYVFIRLDDRARSNITAFDNTKPKDLYGRIVSSFFDSLTDLLMKK